MTTIMQRNCPHPQHLSSFDIPLQADDVEEDGAAPGVVSFVSHTANKYPKQKKPRTASNTDPKAVTKAPQAARTLLKAGELVHVATDVPLAAQHDMFGSVDSSTFQVCQLCTIANGVK